MRAQSAERASAAPSSANKASAAPTSLFKWLHTAAADDEEQATVALEYDTEFELDTVVTPIIPRGAFINYMKRTARIPARWRLAIATFVLDLSGLDVRPPAFCIDDVARDSTVRAILGEVPNWARGAGLAALYARDLRLAYYKKVADRPPSSLPELVLLDPDDTAEDADLFNRAPDLVVVHTDLVDNARARVAAANGASSSNGMWGSRRSASQPAYNTRPEAPEHIGMVNALLGQEDDAAAATNLPGALDPGSKKLLQKHLNHITKIPSRVCFQCGWLLYPTRPRPSTCATSPPRSSAARTACSHTTSTECCLRVRQCSGFFSMSL